MPLSADQSGMSLRKIITSGADEWDELPRIIREILDGHVRDDG
jgi:hypothetical protein